MHTRLCKIAHAQWHGCKSFGTASYLILHQFWTTLLPVPVELRKGGFV